MTESGGCYRCCFGFILSSGLTALFMWLTLRPSKPSFSIDYFYLPALDKTLNSTTNTTINIGLKLKNTNKNKGVYYDSINVTFYDDPNGTHRVGNLTIPRFHQGHGKGAKMLKSAETYDVHRVAVFRVDLATAVRYEILKFKTKREKVAVGANVVVNDEGSKDRKSIKLRSGAPPEHGCYSARPGFGVFVNVLMIVFLHFCG